jgi:hypothetical protein
MQELINKLTAGGLTEQQAENSITAVSKWLEENFPVAGVLVSSWIKAEMAKTESQPHL